MYIFIDLVEAITKHKSYVRDAKNWLTLARHVKISENYVNSYELTWKIGILTQRFATVNLAKKKILLHQNFNDFSKKNVERLDELQDP